MSRNNRSILKPCLEDVEFYDGDVISDDKYSVYSQSQHQSSFQDSFDSSMDKYYYLMESNRNLGSHVDIFTFASMLLRDKKLQTLNTVSWENIRTTDEYDNSTYFTESIANDPTTEEEEEDEDDDDKYSVATTEDLEDYDDFDNMLISGDVECMKKNVLEKSIKSDNTKRSVTSDTVKIIESDNTKSTGTTNVVKIIESDNTKITDTTNIVKTIESDDTKLIDTTNIVTPYEELPSSLEQIHDKEFQPTTKKKREKKTIGKKVLKGARGAITSMSGVYQSVILRKPEKKVKNRKQQKRKSNKTETITPSVEPEQNFTTQTAGESISQTPSSVPLLDSSSGYKTTTTEPTPTETITNHNPTSSDLRLLASEVVSSAIATFRFSSDSTLAYSSAVSILVSSARCSECPKTHFTAVHAAHAATKKIIRGEHENDVMDAVLKILSVEGFDIGSEEKTRDNGGCFGSRVLDNLCGKRSRRDDNSLATNDVDGGGWDWRSENKNDVHQRDIALENVGVCGEGEVLKIGRVGGTYKSNEVMEASSRNFLELFSEDEPVDEQQQGQCGGMYDDYKNDTRKKLLRIVEINDDLNKNQTQSMISQSSSILSADIYSTTSVASSIKSRPRSKRDIFATNISHAAVSNACAVLKFRGNVRSAQMAAAAVLLRELENYNLKYAVVGEEMSPKMKRKLLKNYAKVASEGGIIAVSAIIAGYSDDQAAEVVKKIITWNA